MPDPARRRIVAAAAAAGGLALAGWTRAARAEDAPFERATRQTLAPVPLTDMDGAAVALESLRGRPALVNLWATWCEPCRAEMPSLDALQAVSDDEVRVVALNVGESPDRIRRFVQQSGLAVTVWRAPSSVLKTWGVRILPTTLLLDAQGRVRLQVTGARDWSDTATREAIASLRAPRGRT
mgnify:CR=1 FL=1